MKQKKLRCIMVGLRNRGSTITKLVFQQPDRFQPVALVDATADIAREECAKQGWPFLPCFTSIGEALEKVKADACIITSPAKFHTSQTRTALEAGLHVFIAKPLTYSLDEAADLVKMAALKKLCMVVDQQQRHSLTERTLSSWVREERFGKVGFISFAVHRHRPEMKSFTGTNPFIWEQGVHSFDSLISILDRPVLSITAHQMKPAWSTYQGPTVVMGVLEFEGGLPCNYTGTFDSQASNIEMRFDCEKGAIRAVANNSWTKHLEVASLGGSFEDAKVRDTDDPTPREMWNFEAFHRGCIEGGRVTNDGRSNLRTLAAVDAFVRSAKSGQRETVRSFE